MTMSADAPLLVVVAGPARRQVATVDRPISIGRDTSSSLCISDQNWNCVRTDVTTQPSSMDDVFLQLVTRREPVIFGALMHRYAKFLDRGGNRGVYVADRRQSSHDSSPVIWQIIPANPS